ncbi:hypothetical protein SAMN02745147_2097 [Intestinibacter bartlettii DSM 16795]|uniref:metallophosphoesterase n=1 Tax=Intestinibacter bartlettii TaxID=261299 RepID=UPI0001631270|nr:metallophosphoesterase [Intestinibacter bartlettii]EDQ95607.1 Ser/Thr phosphatase family protein [Intestinibacter bartlettii DSM 16795]UWO80611.1 metallophosphoesterase [Intestinibacter bartlettii]SKA58605.1 hypothetical protein SAMN02745147_2097 [Intestinibacter bartlettii DSM 16795]
MNQQKEKKNIILILLTIFIIVSVFCIYEIYISYKGLIVNNYCIKTNEISNNSNIKFAVIGDLHNYEFNDDNQVLIEKIKKQHPNLIFIAGDMLNSDSENSDIVICLVKKLVKIAPVYYALGNHEFDYIKNRDSRLVGKIENTGAVVLENKYKDIIIKGETLRIGGMFSYAFGKEDKVDKKTMDKNVYRFLEEFQNTSNYKIMISHRPDSFIFGNASEVWDINLIVSAHNHGGQVVIPFLGGFYGGDQGYLPKYTHGVYNKGKMKIAITSGLSSNLKKLPRFNNRPEIMIIDINGEK